MTLISRSLAFHGTFIVKIRVNSHWTLSMLYIILGPVSWKSPLSWRGFSRSRASLIASLIAQASLTHTKEEEWLLQLVSFEATWLNSIWLCFGVSLPSRWVQSGLPHAVKCPLQGKTMVIHLCQWLGWKVHLKGEKSGNTPSYGSNVTFSY